MQRFVRSLISGAQGFTGGNYAVKNILAADTMVGTPHTHDSGVIEIPISVTENVVRGTAIERRTLICVQWNAIIPLI